MEQSDDDILKPEDMAAIFGVNRRTLLQMVRDGTAPRPLGGKKPPFRWRWGGVKKWYQAMETLYGVGFAGGKTIQDATKNDESRQNTARDDSSPSKPKKQ